MRRLIFALGAAALLTVGLAAPASACHISGQTDCDDLDGPPWGPLKASGKPSVDWLLAVLDGNANDKNTAAISKNH